MEIDLRTVRPTQTSLGFRVVERKMRDLSRLDNLELQKFLIIRAAPIVIGPHNTVFVQDRQHEFAALLQMGHSKGYGKVTGDFSHLSWDEFKEIMTSRRKVYLSRLGQPITFDELPIRISEMINDPLRSIASEIRKDGAYRKSSEPFGENEWADALRGFIPHELAANFPESARMLAKTWAHTQRAAHLPGFFAARSCRQLHLQFSR